MGVVFVSHSDSTSVLKMPTEVECRILLSVSVNVCKLLESSATGGAVSDVGEARSAGDVIILTQHNVVVVKNAIADRAFHICNISDLCDSCLLTITAPASKVNAAHDHKTDSYRRN